jgi:hypothetical protein
MSLREAFLTLQRDLTSGEGDAPTAVTADPLPGRPISTCAYAGGEAQRLYFLDQVKTRGDPRTVSPWRDWQSEQERRAYTFPSLLASSEAVSPGGFAGKAQPDRTGAAIAGLDS